jgi:hypothetical protein
MTMAVVGRKVDKIGRLTFAFSTRKCYCLDVRQRRANAFIRYHVIVLFTYVVNSGRFSS